MIDIANRNKLFFIWDCREVVFSPSQIPQVWNTLREYLIKRFRTVSIHFLKRAWITSKHEELYEVLRRLRFRIRVCERENTTQQIIRQCQSDCGRDPNNTILIFGSEDVRFCDLLEKLYGIGVAVYLWASETALDTLVDVVNAEHWIRLREPEIVCSYLREVNKFTGQYVNRGRIVQQLTASWCKCPELNPRYIGFRSRKTFQALFDWLIEQGFVEYETDPSQPDLFSIVEENSERFEPTKTL